MAAGAAAQTGGIAVAGALLHLFAFFADGCLQGSVDAVAISAILRRLARSQLCHHFRLFPPAVSNNHPALRDLGAAVPRWANKRRDQSDGAEPAGDAGE